MDEGNVGTFGEYQGINAGKEHERVEDEGGDGVFDAECRNDVPHQCGGCTHAQPAAGVGIDG